jgi:hypothetical protein
MKINIKDNTITDYFIDSNKIRVKYRLYLDTNKLVMDEDDNKDIDKTKRVTKYAEVKPS